MSFEPQSSPAAPATARYERGDLLEEGSLFLLYAGRDRETGRPVALHLLRPEYARDRLFVDRLRAEVLKAVSLKHPGIVSVYDLDSDDGVVVVTALRRGVHLTA